MSLEDVTTKLAAILVEYQDPAQEPVDGIRPDCIPLADLSGFDSQFIPEVVRRLARELGEPLLEGTKIRNIFIDRGKKLNVSEIARNYAAAYPRAESPV